MRKEDYQDVMWLFQELGQCLRSKRPNVPRDWDTRALLRDVVENHSSTFFGGRNPFNWLKELQTTLNFWQHLQVASDVPEDDIWRDLDTLERVAGYLGLDSTFVESVHDVKNKILVERESQYAQPGQEEIRSLITEEVSLQLEVWRHKIPEQILSRIREEVLENLQGPTRVSAGDGVGAPKTEPVGSPERGAHAERVRHFVIDTYIEPARTEGQKEVRVRAGDADKALGYQYRRLPLICVALRSKKFLSAARVELRSEVGPPSGASTTTTFLYELLE